MDSYLLYGRILRARVVPKARIHADLFKGANRRFKAIPWNKMAGRHLEKPAGESTWNTRIEKERRRRTARAEKLKETMGYEFEGPELKVVQGSAAVGLEDGEGESTEAIEAPRTAAEKEPERPVTDRAGDEPADTIGTSGQSKKIKAGKKSGKKNKVNKA